MSEENIEAIKMAKWLVRGRVQGVSYRLFTRSQAQPLDLVGTVRNLTDGRVEVLVRGTADQLAALHQQLLVGPRLGKVDGIEEEPLSDEETTLLEQARSFEIVH